MSKTAKIFISMALIVCTLVTVVSCGSTSADTTIPTPDALESNTPSVIPDDTPAPETSVPAPETSVPTPETSAPTPETSTPEVAEEEPEPEKTLALANPNTVLLDSNGVKLTALDFGDQTNDSEIIIDVRVENTNTHGVNISLNSLTVNGYLISGKLVSFTTKAGADEIVSLNISKRDLAFAEIDEIREILVSFYAKDDQFKMFISPTEPVSLKTTQFDTPSPELDVSGVQVYNDNHILIVAKEELSSDSRYMFVKLLIKNAADYGIYVSCDRLLVNGQALTNFNCIRYGRVAAGIISYNSMDIEKSELEKLGIQEIETVEMTLKVMTNDYSLIAENLTVTVRYE